MQIGNLNAIAPAFDANKHGECEKFRHSYWRKELIDEVDCELRV